MSKLIKWDPFKELADMHTRLNSIFSPRAEANAVWPAEQSLLGDVDWAPAVDVSEDDEEYLITADLPEVEKDQVKVTVENGALVITGERTQEKEERKKKKYHRIERSYGKYSRSFRIPEDVAADQISASFKKGVLNVHLPKSPEKRQGVSEVKVS